MYIHVRCTYVIYGVHVKERDEKWREEGGEREKEKRRRGKEGGGGERKKCKQKTSSSICMCTCIYSVHVQPWFFEPYM